MTEVIKSNLTPIEISRRVKAKLESNGLTLEKCCNSFNLKYSKEIKEGKLRPLNKDFLSRVSRKNGFKVISLRIAKICEFLNVDIEGETRATLLSDEIRSFKTQVENNPKMQERYKTLTEFLTEISSVKL